MSSEGLPTIITFLPQQIREQIQNPTYEIVKEATDRFVRQSGLRLKAGNWLYDQEPTDVYFAGNTEAFKLVGADQVSSLQTPFVEKHEVAAGSKIIVIGDIHGNIESLATVLVDLHKKGILDDDYCLTNDNTKLVFLGDYSNRMPHSVEVMLLLFYLHTQNIGSVFLLRGNHEIIVCNKSFYDKFDHINNTQDPNGIETLLGEFARKFDLYYFPDLLYWYDYLPMANFIGCRDSKTNTLNTIQFCHGGIELGYNPGNLLASSDARFHYISSLNRYNVLQKIFSAKELEPLHDRMQFVCNYIGETDLAEWLHLYTERNRIAFDEPQNLLKTKLGFQWNSFLTEANDDIDFAISQNHRSMLFGSKLTRHLLDLAKTPQAEILSVIRGHQHLNDYDEDLDLNCNMLDVIINGRGCARQWDGMVYTMGDSGGITEYQTYLVITMQEDKEQWHVQHYFKKDGADAFECEEAPYFGTLE